MLGCCSVSVSGPRSRTSIVADATLADATEAAAVATPRARTLKNDGLLMAQAPAGFGQRNSRACHAQSSVLLGLARNLISSLNPARFEPNHPLVGMRGR